MATENKSPSYLRDREQARRWMSQTKEGREAAKFLKEHSPGHDPAELFDDDKHVEWSDLVRETKDLLMIQANAREAREAFQMARQSSSVMAAPSASKDMWRKIFSPPLGYFFRRQLEQADPGYWNDPKNVYREALNNPQWCCVPAEHIRGSLEKYLPKGEKVPITQGYELRQQHEDAQPAINELYRTTPRTDA